MSSLYVLDIIKYLSDALSTIFSLIRLCVFLVLAYGFVLFVCLFQQSETFICSVPIGLFLFLWQWYHAIEKALWGSKLGMFWEGLYNLVIAGVISQVHKKSAWREALILYDWHLYKRGNVGRFLLLGWEKSRCCFLPVKGSVDQPFPASQLLGEKPWPFCFPAGALSWTLVFRRGRPSINFL